MLTLDLGPGGKGIEMDERLRSVLGMYRDEHRTCVMVSFMCQLG